QGAGQYRFAGWAGLVPIGHVVAPPPQQKRVLRAKWPMRMCKRPCALRSRSPIVEDLGSIGILVGIPRRHQPSDGKPIGPGRQRHGRTGSYFWRQLLDCLARTITLGREGSDAEVQASRPPGSRLICVMTSSADVAET